MIPPNLLHLAITEPLLVVADALVVEDSGWLSAERGLAAQVDQLFSTLQPQRTQYIAQCGALALGAAAAFVVGAQEGSFRAVVYTVTFTYPAQPAQAEQRMRATPLVVATATRNALLRAAEIGARHVVLPALGTRLGHHSLPPTPKKLPRYVMGAAQLIGIEQALEQTTMLERITLAVTHRDYAIFRELLGAGADSVDGDTDDE